jgi:phage-related protein
MKGFHDYAGFMMDPIMAEFSVVNDTISEVGDAMHSIRGMMGGVRGGFLGILGTVFGKIHNVMSQFQYIIIRMRTLLSRIVGVMMSFLMVFYTGMETGQSVMNGPIMGVIRAL